MKYWMQGFGIAMFLEHIKATKDYRKIYNLPLTYNFV